MCCKIQKCLRGTECAVPGESSSGSDRKKLSEGIGCFPHFLGCSRHSALLLICVAVEEWSPT